MIKCDFCEKVFYESENGLLQKAMHEVLHDPEVINA